MRGALLWLLIGVAGCAKAYKADAFAGPLPESHVATLHITNLVRFVYLDWRAVDGIPMCLGDGIGATFEPSRTVRLAPGEHSILAGFCPFHRDDEPTGSDDLRPIEISPRVTEYRGSDRNDILEFTAEPGHHYHLTLNITWDAWADVQEWEAEVREGRKVVSKRINRISNSVRFPRASSGPAR